MIASRLNCCSKFKTLHACRHPNFHTPSLTKIAYHPLPIARKQALGGYVKGCKLYNRGEVFSCRAKRDIVFSSESKGNNSQEVWDNFQLLDRQLQLAITEENYTEAARLRDERNLVLEDLSDHTKALLEVVENFRSSKRDDRMSSLKLLGGYLDRRTLPALYEALADQDEEVSAEAEQVIWNIFCKSGNAQVDSMLQNGMMAMQMVNNLHNARAIYDEVIHLAPDFAEGYNKRATVKYLQKDFKGAIVDCIETLRLEPDHFGALSGQGLCHIALDQPEEALEALQKAVQVNPRLEQIRSYCEELEAVVEKKRQQDVEEIDRDV